MENQIWGASSATTCFSGFKQLVRGVSGTTATGWTSVAGSGAGSKTLVNASTGTTTLTAAMKLGSISITPSKAGVYTITLSADPTVGATRTATMVVTAVANLGDVGLGCTVSLEGASAASTCTGQVGGQVKVLFAPAAAGTYSATVTNATMLSIADTEGAAGAAATVAASAKTNTIDYKNGWTAIPVANNVADDDYYVTTLTASAAGTSTFSVTTTSSTTGVITVYDTLTITWASGSSLDPSAGTSTSIIDGSGTLTTNAHDAATDETVIAPGTSATTLVASIKVTARDGNGNLLADGKTVTAVIAGPGIAGGAAAAIDTYANGSRYETVTLTGGTGLAFFGIYADGTSGKSTISIMSGSTLLATETVTFHGRPATVTVVQNHRIGSINGEVLGIDAGNPSGADIDNTPAVTVSVKDAAGLPVSALTVSQVSSDTTVMASAADTCTESAGTTAGDGYAGEGFYNCSVASVANPTGSGKTATITFRVPDGITSGVFVSATPVTYTLGRDPASVKLTTDKATYAPGEKITLTVSALGSDAKAAADDIYTNLLSAAGLSGSTSLGGTLPGASVATVNGVKTYTLYAPLVSGTFTISGAQGADTGTGLGAAITTSFTVGSNSEMQAVTTLINSLIAKINALNKLVIKIQKKVRA